MGLINLSKKELLNKIEFGDFQTPKVLADLMSFIIKDKYNYSPNCIIEPTCGKGSILVSAVKTFTNCNKNIGIEINSNYLEELENISKKDNLKLTLLNQDFFTIDLKAKLKLEESNILLIGNPPWVTNSGLGKIDSENLPQKSNFKNLKGIDAITGKSNFDLSEYILLSLTDLFLTSDCMFAFLCKTSVARKILLSLSDNNIQPELIDIYPIDSKKYFNASVDACFFVFKLSSNKNKIFCNIYKSIEERIIVQTIGIENRTIVNNIHKFQGLKKFIGKSDYVWRNGIKHDAASVMELSLNKDNIFQNREGKLVDIEDNLVYPLLKSSDLANRNLIPRKCVIITQKKIGENTNYIETAFPKTWKYLNENLEIFTNRKSSIYKNKPLFSIFSVGEYSFYPYKIAISGLYKNIRFSILEPYLDKTVQVDDTCNFISCKSLEEAKFIYELLSSSFVKELLESLIFWDSKRPVTTEVLNKLDLRKIAEELGYSIEYNSFVSKNKYCIKSENNLSLFILEPNDSTENATNVFESKKYSFSR
ncbi:MAG TPA: hypothetical protein PKL30_25025 [Leptospiraceae bacterium]|nr:hypothetical protein [Leptospiraceae bacterium]HNC59937.1 hypothetical protein [Leptospiraceae bacterium]HNF57887.1 hypothetical protein [Leptospiraceae bacterium]HNH02901.1 hypothetical protein [Leptospiraceae bacterium]HNH58358.1 hypothetical protein [Leptospiraceae bacterium]